MEEERPFLRKQLVRLGMFAASASIVLVATVVLLGGEDIARFVGSVLGLRGTGVRIWNLIQFPLAFAFLVALAFMVFYFLPNVKQQDWRRVLVAAVVTSAAVDRRDAAVPALCPELRELQPDLWDDRRHHRPADVDVPVDVRRHFAVASSRPSCSMAPARRSP